jgi:CheY-like chemotaxis protein
MVITMETLEGKLFSSLDEIRYCLDQLDDARSGVNDPSLNRKLTDFLTGALGVVGWQRQAVRSSVADDLTSLLEGLRSIDIPAQVDDDIGRTPGLGVLRGVQGQIMLGLMRAIEYAGELGFEPKISFVGALPTKMSDATLSVSLKSLAGRIQELEASLDELEVSQKKDTQVFLQQSDLVAMTVGSLRSEAGLVRFLINSGIAQTTATALLRTLESMTERTANFWATMVAWRNRISVAVFQSSDQLRKKVSRALRGAKAAINWNSRRASQPLADDAVAHLDQASEGNRSLSMYRAMLGRYARALLGSEAIAEKYLHMMDEDISESSRIWHEDNLRLQVFKIFHQTIERNGEPPYPTNVDDGLPTDRSALVRSLDLSTREVILLMGLEGFSIRLVSEIVRAHQDILVHQLVRASKLLVPVLATRALVIEPDQAAYERIAAVAERIGLDVFMRARTATEAVQISNAEPIGLIIAEIQLSDGSSGLTAVNEILEYQSVPVIFLTAYPERFLTGLRPTPAFLIAKPFDDAILTAAIVQTLVFKKDAISGNQTKSRTVYVLARPKGRPEGSAISDYVVEDRENRVLGTFKTQREAIEWAKQVASAIHVARVRHLNDKTKPEQWRAV